MDNAMSEDKPAEEMPMRGWSNMRTDEFIRRYANCMAALQEARADLKALAEEAKEAGFNPSALKRAVILLADESGRAKIRAENDIGDLISVMRDAGSPMVVE